MAKVVLKNLSTEFDIDPYKLRMMLRKKFKTPVGGRWAWEDEKDPQLKEIRAWLKKETGSVSSKPQKPKRVREKASKRSTPSPQEDGSATDTE